MPVIFLDLNISLIIIIILGKILLIENQYFVEMDQARRNLTVINENNTYIIFCDKYLELNVIADQKPCIESKPYGKYT